MYEEKDAKASELIELLGNKYLNDIQIKLLNEYGNAVISVSVKVRDDNGNTYDIEPEGLTSYL